MTPTDYSPLKKAGCYQGRPVIRPAEHYDQNAAKKSNIRAVTGVIDGEPEKRGVTWYVPVRRDDTGAIEFIALSRLKVDSRVA